MFDRAHILLLEKTFVSVCRKEISVERGRLNTAQHRNKDKRRSSIKPGRYLCQCWCTDARCSLLPWHSLGSSQHSLYSFTFLKASNSDRFRPSQREREIQNGEWEKQLLGSVGVRRTNTHYIIDVTWLYRCECTCNLHDYITIFRLLDTCFVMIKDHNF